VRACGVLRVAGTAGNVWEAPLISLAIISALWAIAGIVDYLAYRALLRRLRVVERVIAEAVAEEATGRRVYVDKNAN
jgi:membrane protein implicated in regulation of membrane protease activity